MSDEDQTEQAAADEAMSDDWAAAMEEQAASEGDAGGGGDTAQFQELQEDQIANGNGDIQLDAILDVPVVMSMEIGRTRINIRNLLQLNQGSVVELDRLAGEPMDVLVNGTLIAQGEVVVVNEKFGIRLTDIVSPADRIKQLKG